MALFNIEFKHVQIYYATETIRAENQEEAESIARRLLDSIAFESYLVDTSQYDDHEDSFLYAYEVEEGDGKFQHRETMTADEINEYLED